MVSGFSTFIADTSVKHSTFSAGTGYVKMFCRIAIIALIVAVTAKAVANPKPVFRNAEQGRRVSAANGKFAFRLHKRQTRPTQQNLFYSPISISLALAMTYLGARGQTKSQMKEVLRFADVKEYQLHWAFADIQSALNKSEEGCKLYVANRLFADKSYKCLDDFRAAQVKYYRATLKPVDFG